MRNPWNSMPIMTPMGNRAPTLVAPVTVPKERICKKCGARIDCHDRYSIKTDDEMHIIFYCKKCDPDKGKR